MAARDLREAICYASTLAKAKRFEEAVSLLRTTAPVVRRVLGETNETTLRMRWVYALALYRNDDASLDDLREAVTTLEDTAPTARLVLGGEHPTTKDIEFDLHHARAALAYQCDLETRRFLGKLINLVG